METVVRWKARRLKLEKKPRFHIVDVERNNGGSFIEFISPAETYGMDHDGPGAYRA